MALVTLCPECSTTFRVTAEQLEAHSGDVRCGQCQHVFNSFATLITVEESEISRLAETNTPTLIETSVTVETKAAINDFEEDDDNFDSKPVKEKLNLRWASACGVLVFLLIGQLVYFYRVDISVTVPAAKPWLVTYCAILNCTIPPPQDISLLSIESSGLYANPMRQTETTMTAIIRNYASFPQVLPALKLLLTDKKGESIASRVFNADDYLDDEAESLQSIEPNHEVNIRLDYDSGELNATGYQLFLLYP